MLHRNKPQQCVYLTDGFCTLTDLCLRFSVALLYGSRSRLAGGGRVAVPFFIDRRRGVGITGLFCAGSEELLLVRYGLL